MILLPTSRHLFSLSLVLLIAACLTLICLADDHITDDAHAKSSILASAGQQSARSRFALQKLFDFERFKRVFKKRYSSIVEEVARARLYLGRAFRSFVSAVSYKHRKASSYLAINHMSDWTPEEVRRIDVAPGALMDMLGAGLDVDQASMKEEELVPAASFDEVESALEEIVQRGSEQPALKMLADEINSSLPVRRRRGATGASAGSRRQISLDDLARNPDGERVELGERVGSNNPAYQPPELTSFGSSDESPKKSLSWRDSDFIINLPGKSFLNTVLETANDVLKKNKPDEAVALPDEVFTDHRGECMFAPRNQGECGSCYAFAAVTVYEWLYCKATGKKVAFSEQYLVDCGKSSGLDGCDGGYISKVPEFIRKNGIELRANYPYRERQDQCPYDNSIPDINRGYLRISIERLRGINEPNFEDTLKTSPMVLALFVSDAFHEYGGGVHDGAGCDANRAHAVVLVGSGREDNQEYWLFRNSYSPTYGEGGYYKLNKNAKHCISKQQAYLYSGITGVSKEQGLNPRYLSRAVKRRYHEYLASNIASDED